MMFHVRRGIYRRCFALAYCFGIAGCFSEATLAAEDSTQKSALRPTIIEATDKDAVLAAMPQIVNVCGTVSQIKDNDGNLAINFNGTEQSQFYAVVLKRNRDSVEKVHGEALKSLDGKKVQISGKIAMYREKPQIVVSLPEQIGLSNESKAAPTGSLETSKPPHAVIDATDKAAVLAAMPQEIVVTGTVRDIKDSGGVLMINFAGTEKSQFYGVVLSRNRAAVEKIHGEALNSLDGKRVQLRGKIVEYHEKPEIIISLPEQIALTAE
jgi:DNA/RNA endonuclease YhcR with UshA esterase domain